MKLWNTRLYTLANTYQHSLPTCALCIIHTHTHTHQMDRILHTMGAPFRCKDTLLHSLLYYTVYVCEVHNAVLVHKCSFSISNTHTLGPIQCLNENCFQTLYSVYVCNVLESVREKDGGWSKAPHSVLVLLSHIQYTSHTYSIHTPHTHTKGPSVRASGPFTRDMSLCGGPLHRAIQCTHTHTHTLSK